MPADNLHELFDVCDADDRVIGQAPRGEVHARGLMHRAVHIFVFNSRGQFLVHHRSAHKDEYPRRITSSCSGHLNAGEDYDTAAGRELQEELGLTAPLEYIGSFPAGPETANEHTRLYRATTDDTPVPDLHEIESLEWADPHDVAVRMQEHPEKFTPPFRMLFAWYLRRET